jgi:hypothetical protein
VRWSAAGSKRGAVTAALQQLQRRPDRSAHLDGARGGLQAGGTAHEQLVAKRQAQAAQGVADRRLGQAQLGARPGRALLLQQGVEHPQQVEVEISEMHIIHDWRDGISFCS